MTKGEEAPHKQQRRQPFMALRRTLHASSLSRQTSSRVSSVSSGRGDEAFSLVRSVVSTVLGSSSGEEEEEEDAFRPRRLFVSPSASKEVTEENGRQKQLRQRMLQRRYSSTSDCNISNNKFSNNRYNSRISSSLLTSQVRGYAFWSSNDNNNNNNNNNNNESPSSSSSTTNELENGSSSMSTCLLYTSPSPRDGLLARMPSSA